MKLTLDYRQSACCSEEGRGDGFPEERGDLGDGFPEWMLVMAASAMGGGDSRRFP